MILTADLTDLSKPYAKHLEGLGRELQNELPEEKGFSERNIKLMVQFAHEYPDAFAPLTSIGQPPVAQMPASSEGQQLVAQIPWAHNVLLMLLFDWR